jgi:chromosomal replication initiator protein
MQQVNTRKIQHFVAEYYNIEVEEMLSGSREPNLTEARQVAMYLAREVTGASFPSLAARFRKHHTTVLHAVREIRARAQKDAALRAKLASLRQKLEVNGSSAAQCSEVGHRSVT